MPMPAGLRPPQGRKDLDKFQQTAGRLVSNPKFKDALSELESNPQARNEAKGNAKGYLKSKGLDIPDDAEVEFEEGSIYVRICYWGYCLIFYG